MRAAVEGEEWLAEHALVEPFGEGKREAHAVGKWIGGVVVANEVERLFGVELGVFPDTKIGRET